MAGHAPVIGITAEIEWREGARPPRAGYALDARNFDALRIGDCAPVMLPHELYRANDYLDFLDGLFVSGGGYQFQHPDLFPEELPDDVPEYKFKRTEFEIRMVKEALRRQLPLLGVCGGFQVLNRVLGGKLIVDLEKERPSEISHRQEGPYNEGSHVVAVQPDTVMAGLVSDREFTVNSLHRQGVIETGPGARVAATAPDGIVEAIEARDHPFALGIQWHLEFFITRNDRAIVEGFLAACRAYSGRKQA